MNEWMTGYREVWEARLGRLGAELERRRSTRKDKGNKERRK
jgi:hypothetical protein